MELNINRVHTAILFAILFVSVGWVAPAAYASYTPESHYMELHSFTAENATTTDDYHLVCFDIEVHKPSTGTVYSELYLVSDNGERVEVDSTRQEWYFQEGDHKVETRMSLPEYIEAGEYRYVLLIQMDLAQGRVERDFEYVSDTFHITESNNSTNSSTADFAC